MSSTRVSVLVPAESGMNELARTRDVLARYLESTGFDFDITTVKRREAESGGAALRRAVVDAPGDIIVIVDADPAYDVGAVGDAIAMVRAGSEVVFASQPVYRRHALPVRWLLVSRLPDDGLALKAFSSQAAKVIFGESKLHGGGCDLEIAYLASKYGFRVERLRVETAAPARRPLHACSPLVSAIQIRWTDHRMGYRAPRRCPVCFSTDVWTRGQAGSSVVRACSRCKCRYLTRFGREPEDERRPPELRAHTAPASGEVSRGDTARTKTSLRRLSAIRDHLSARARLLEIGVRDGSFGLEAAREYEYVGIDRASGAVRHARSAGLEVYCANVGDFVNTGAAFDAIALFHVFENLADPHDALARLRDLLKPGGVLFLSAFDSESLLYMLYERRQMSQYFRTHLIIYSRSALIELLEHSGFEILSINPEFEYRDHAFLRHWIASGHPAIRPVVHAALRLLPDPLLISSGSIRIMAKRRAGPPADLRTVRSVEPMHAG